MVEAMISLARQAMIMEEEIVSLKENEETCLILEGLVEGAKQNLANTS